MYSYVGTTRSSLASLNGDVARQSSLLNDWRYDPLNVSLPDLVIALTSPPPKRPNSAETPEVATVVSCSASSMYSVNGWPRRFSVITTPLTAKRLSYDIEPAIEYPPLAPVACTAGPIRIEASSERFDGSVAISS